MMVGLKKASLFCLMAGIVPVAAIAHEGHEHKVMGTVAAVSETQLDVDAKGEVTTVHLTAQTRFERGDAEADASAIEAGERVVVVYQEKDGQKQAKRVMLPPPAGNEKDE